MCYDMQVLVLIVESICLLVWTLSLPLVGDECWDQLPAPDGFDAKHLFILAAILTWIVLLTYVFTLLLVCDAVSKMSPLDRTR